MIGKTSLLGPMLIQLQWKIFVILISKIILSNFLKRRRDTESKNLKSVKIKKWKSSALIKLCDLQW